MKRYLKYSIDNLNVLLNYGITKKEIKNLLENGILNLEVLSRLPKREIISIKGISENKVLKIVELANRLTLNGFFTGYQLIEKEKYKNYFSTLNKRIDLILGGGISSGSITEIYGESNAGKTQLCHILCISLNKNTLSYCPEKKIVYIDTEGNFSLKRLFSLCEKNNLNFDKTINNLFYAKAYSTDHQFQLLIAVASLASYSNVSIVIIDSCTSLFRTEYSGRGELFIRQSMLGKFIRNVRRLCDNYNLAFVLTNQMVTSNLENSSYFSGPESKPIGGNIMRHYTNTKILLRKSINYRTFKLESSSDMPEKEIKV
uniref:DNA recombination and repair protein n=1 Tax=Amorphochlora amoebiformis TaxID=1561963 RepID=A0A0H5BR22_9EUKA|nr:DNA recombination and repair protein [Amorphochlora amoebiformis]